MTPVKPFLSFQILPQTSQANAQSATTNSNREDTFKHSILKSTQHSLQQGLGIPYLARQWFGSSAALSLVTGGLATCIIGILTTIGKASNSSWLNWGNTSLATWQNAEIPSALNVIQRETAKLEKILKLSSRIEFRQRSAISDTWTTLDPLRRFFGKVNQYQRSAITSIAAVLGSEIGTTVAFSALLALWTGRLIVWSNNKDTDELLTWVNAVPQFPSTAYTALILYVAKRHSDRLRSLHRHLEQLEASTTSPASPEEDTPNLSNRWLNEFLHLTGNESNVLLYITAASVCATLSAIYSVNSPFTATANAVLAAVQFPDVMLTKAITSQDRRFAQYLRQNYPQSLGQEQNEAEPVAQHAVVDCLQNSQQQLANLWQHTSQQLGDPRALQIIFLALASLVLSRIAINNDSWLSIFNTSMQMLATPVLGLILNDLLKGTHLVLPYQKLGQLLTNSNDNTKTLAQAV